MKVFNTLLCTGACITLGACSLLTASPQNPDTPLVSTDFVAKTLPQQEPVSNALELFEQDRLLAPPERERETARLETLVQRNALAQLRLAWLLSLRHDPAVRARILNLLETMPQTHPAEAKTLAPLTAWITHELKERATLEDKLEQLNQQVRETQARSDVLSSKIQELKAIERSLVSRPSPDAGDRPPSKP